MKILSIETSCDDTGITIMEVKGGVKDASFRVLANNLSSQVKIHTQYGGVYPVLAKQEHKKNLPILLEKSLREITSPNPLQKREGESVVESVNSIWPAEELSQLYPP